MWFIHFWDSSKSFDWIWYNSRLLHSLHWILRFFIIILLVCGRREKCLPVEDYHRGRHHSRPCTTRRHIRGRHSYCRGTWRPGRRRKPPDRCPDGSSATGPSTSSWGRNRERRSTTPSYRDLRHERRSSAPERRSLRRFRRWPPPWWACHRFWPTRQQMAPAVLYPVECPGWPSASHRWNWPLECPACRCWARRSPPSASCSPRSSGWPLKCPKSTSRNEKKNEFVLFKLNSDSIRIKNCYWLALSVTLDTSVFTCYSFERHLRILWAH